MNYFSRNRINYDMETGFQLHIKLCSRIVYLINKRTNEEAVGSTWPNIYFQFIFLTKCQRVLGTGAISNPFPIGRPKKKRKKSESKPKQRNWLKLVWDCINLREKWWEMKYIVTCRMASTSTMRIFGWLLVSVPIVIPDADFVSKFV